MKPFTLCCLFCLFFNVVNAQDDIKTHDIYYKISLATTLTINKDYTFDQDDDSGPLINPSALFVNNTFGYQFDERSMIGFNLEYDYHSEQGLHFMPAYLNFQYNITNSDIPFFIRGGYGRLLNVGKSFEKGTMYKVGLGGRFYDDDYKNSVHLGLDFTRKRFGFKQEDKLSSVSIFIEFMVF